ncbi:hypothetical protein P691DRAFT_225301 [Macrolepiota fuliginosa MF-IS2]|uniref:EthD domain-containing protein n=1 Tax=Macrolepiota fuliginosa MF-IS2 TaxID=1400762 RepID=A0A9P5XA63_9AGAR|nr:hypothetical protein P691DRAFT_225301 [Macrolepiota fuliginosa MF-IS2]
MTNLLFIILVTAPSHHPRDADFWQCILDIIHRSEIGQAHETPTSVSRGDKPDRMMSVFSSSRTDTPTTLTAGKSQDDKGKEHVLGIFFEVPQSRESNVGSVLELLGQGLGGRYEGTILSIECRAYRSYPDQAASELVPVKGGTLIINCMTPSQESEESFDRWYAEEHIPLLRAVPGWLSSRRYVLVSSRYAPIEVGKVAAIVPKYLALHEWAHDQFFETLEYKAAVNTPWRTEVIAAVKEKQRFVSKYVGRLEFLASGQSSEQEKVDN